MGVPVLAGCVLRLTMRAQCTEYCVAPASGPATKLPFLYHAVVTGYHDQERCQNRLYPELHCHCKGKGKGPPVGDGGRPMATLLDPMAVPLGSP